MNRQAVIFANQINGIGHVVGDTVFRNGLKQPDVCSDDRVCTNISVASKNGGVRVDGDMVADVGMTLYAFDRVAIVVHLEGFCA